MVDDLRKLKDEAQHASEKGKHRKAAELYLRVAERDHDDPQWRQRAGEALKRAGAAGEALPHLVAAAAGYARQGFLLKAIAMAKVILQIDPRHAATQAMLASLYAAERPPAAAMATVRSVGAPGASIAAVPLAGVVAGARLTDHFPLAAYEIPLSVAAPSAPSLPPIPLFSSLDESSLRRLIDRVKRVERAPGEAVVTEGEAGDALYVVVRGEVEVTVAARPGVAIDRLGEGAFFGEVSLLANSPRSATVRAITACELLEIDRAVVNELLDNDPEVLRTLLGFFRDRLIHRLFSTSPLFSPFSDDEKRALGERFHFLELEAGSLLVEEGRRAPGLIVLLCGECDVIRGASQERIAELGPGDLVGEISLLSHGASAASARARSRIWALGLSRSEFQELIVTHPQVLIHVSELADQRREASSRVRLV